MSSSSKPRAIIVPGNGCPPGKVHKSNWYGWMQEQLVKTGIFSDVILRDMPDPFGAKECEWVPFLLRDCAVDANTLIIGLQRGRSGDEAHGEKSRAGDPSRVLSHRQNTAVRSSTSTALSAIGKRCSYRIFLNCNP
jgi:hypothetical protein